MKMGYLRVKEWRKFQHYKDRNPPWIKLSTSVFQDYDFCSMQDASKLLAVAIWTMASKSKEGRVPHDMDFIKRHCGLSDLVQECHLTELINKGFLIDDSAMLDKSYSDAIPEERQRRGETENNDMAFGLFLDGQSGFKEKTPEWEDEFDKFYRLYPRKEKRERAKKVFRSHTKGRSRAIFRQIEDALREFIALCELFQRPKAYIPHPATWLNDKPWEMTDEERADAFAAASSSGRAGGGSRFDDLAAGIRQADE